MQWQLVIQGRLIDLQQRKIILEDLLEDEQGTEGVRRIKEAIKETDRLIDDNKNFLLSNFQEGEMQ